MHSNWRRSCLVGATSVAIVARIATDAAPQERPRAAYPSQRERPDFPITELLPQVRASLAQHPRLVLEAPPGAGKTTQVPLALLDADWLQGRRIMMLEPRRVAARAAAAFMARATRRSGRRDGRLSHPRRQPGLGAHAHRSRHRRHPHAHAAGRSDAWAKAARTRSAPCCSTNSTSATCPATSAWRWRSTCRRRCARTCASC